MSVCLAMTTENEDKNKFFIMNNRRCNKQQREGFAVNYYFCVQDFIAKGTNWINYILTSGNNKWILYSAASLENLLREMKGIKNDIEFIYNEVNII